MADELWSEGRLVKAAKGVPGSVTDCSGWEADVPEHLWSVGDCVKAARGVRGAVTDCAMWEGKSPVWVVVKIAYLADAATIAKHTSRLVEVMRSLAPELGLVYDPGRSDELAEDHNAHIAVSPTVQVANLEEKLWRLLESVRKADVRVPITGLSLEWDQPLAA